MFTFVHTKENECAKANVLACEHWIVAKLKRLKQLDAKQMSSFIREYYLLVIYWLICSTFTTYAWLWLFNKCKLTWIESRMWFSIKMTFLLPDRTPHTFLHFHFQMEKTLAKRNWIDLLFNGINRKSMRNLRIKHKNSKTKSTSYWLLNFQNYSVPLSPLHRDNHKHKQIPIDTTYKIQSV